MYNLFRMYRGHMADNSYGSGFHKGQSNDFVRTARTFKARTHSEATRKMNRFLTSAQISGSFFVKPD